MSNFTSMKDFTDTANENRRWTAWHKTPSAVTVQNAWFDLALSPGNPSPIYYAGAPLTALPIARSTDGGIWHGENVSPSKKFLKKALVQSATGNITPLPMIFSDVLLAYPFVDQSTGDVQNMTNTLPLPRYATGNGVRAFAVSVAPSSGSGGLTFSINYTNENGVSGRVSPTVTMNTGTVNGQILSSIGSSGAAASVPFLPLQGNDGGIRSIQSCTILSSFDVGLFTLVLCRPLIDITIYGNDAPTELDCYLHKSEMPQIFDDACISFIANPQGSFVSARLQGTMEFVYT